MNCLCFALTYHILNCCHLAGKISHVFRSVTFTYQITEKVLCCAMSGQRTIQNWYRPALDALREGKVSCRISLTNLLNQIFRGLCWDVAGMLSPYRKAAERLLNLKIKSRSKLERYSMILWLCKLGSLLDCPKALMMKGAQETVYLIEKYSFAAIFL